jgi:hypothetical protein
MSRKGRDGYFIIASPISWLEGGVKERGASPPLKHLYENPLVLPVEGPSPHEVYVQVGHQLSGVRTAVNGQPVTAFSYSLFPGDLVGRPDHLPQERYIFVRQVRQRWYMLYGQDEYVYGGYRVDIREGEHLFVTVDNFRRYLSRGDFTENAVGLTLGTVHGNDL